MEYSVAAVRSPKLINVVGAEEVERYTFKSGPSEILKFSKITFLWLFSLYILADPVTVIPEVGSNSPPDTKTGSPRDESPSASHEIRLKAAITKNIIFFMTNFCLKLLPLRRSFCQLADIFNKINPKI